MPTFWKDSLPSMPSKGWKGTVVTKAPSTKPNKNSEKKDKITPIRKISETKKNRIRENGTEKAIFSRVWESSDRKCSVCGGNIVEPKNFMFAHILSKGRYPEFRYNEKNIALVCSIDHHKELDRINAHRDQELIEKLGLKKL